MQLRLALHTAMYIVSVTAVIASAVNPAGTARFLRRHSGRVAAAARTVSETATAERVVSAAEIKSRPGATQAKPRDPRTSEYRIAIGTAFGARLRSPLDSRTAAKNDQVDAELTGPVVQDGVELIPGGSVLHGTIVSAEPARRESPRGRIEIVFTVVQHAETKSRAAILTRPLTFEADAPESAPKRGKRQPIDVTLPAGYAILPALAEPLLVFIPKPR